MLVEIREPDTSSVAIWSSAESVLETKEEPAGLPAVAGAQARLQEDGRLVQTDLPRLQAQSWAGCIFNALEVFGTCQPV